MNRQLFCHVVQRQLPGACGPTSLSSCLCLLGVDASPRALARAAGKGLRVHLDGLDEHELSRAARAYGARCAFVAEPRRARGPIWLKRLHRHLAAGLPAILLVEHFSHWVAAVGVHDGKYVVMDPNDGARAFNRWSHAHVLRAAWNEPEDDEGEPAQYFAILLARRDGAQARFRLTPRFATLCEHGAAQAAALFGYDLRELARRVQPGAQGVDVALAQALADCKACVVGAVTHWSDPASLEADVRAISAVYDQYVAVADAMNVRLSKAFDRAQLVAQMAAIVAAYAWTGAL